MALGLETAAGIDGPLALETCATGLRVGAAFALVHKSEVFDRKDLGDCEAIVDLGEVDLLGADTGKLVSAFRGGTDRGEGGDIALLIEGHVIRSLDNGK